MVQAIQELGFEKGICSINPYIQKRLQNNDISKIMSMERPDISPGFCSLLQRSQITTVSAERSFSILRKLPAKDRNFKVQNEKQLMTLHFNSCRITAELAAYQCCQIFFKFPAEMVSKNKPKITQLLPVEK